MTESLRQAFPYQWKRIFDFFWPISPNDWFQLKSLLIWYYAGQRHLLQLYTWTNLNIRNWIPCCDQFWYLFANSNYE